jgi:hypothetical protein
MQLSVTCSSENPGNQGKKKSNGLAICNWIIKGPKPVLQNRCAFSQSWLMRKFVTLRKGGGQWDEQWGSPGSSTSLDHRSATGMKAPRRFRVCIVPVGLLRLSPTWAMGQLEIGRIVLATERPMCSWSLSNLYVVPLHLIPKSLTPFPVLTVLLNS